MPDPIPANTGTTQNMQDQQRALLSAMAQTGTQAIAQHNAGGAAPDASGGRAAAVAAAAQRAAQVNAPAAQTAANAGAVGGAFDQAAATQGRNAASYGAEQGAINSAAGTYESQVRAAQPLADDQTRRAVAQILADRQDKEAQRAYDQQSLDYNMQKLKLDRDKFDASNSPDAKPLSVSDASALLEKDPAQAQDLMQSNAYGAARQMAMQAAKDGYTLDEFKALIKGKATQPDANGVYLGGTKEPQSDVANLIIAMYGPTFANKDEQAAGTKKLQDMKQYTAQTALDNTIRKGLGPVLAGNVVLPQHP